MGHKSKRSWRRRLQYRAELRDFKGAVENSSARIRKPAVARNDTRHLVSSMAALSRIGNGFAQG